MSEWDDTWFFSNPAERIELERTYVDTNVVDKSGFKILDVGGKDFHQHFQSTPTIYTMIDIDTPLVTGTGGYNAHPEGQLFDGKLLPFVEDDFDAIIMGYMLHHAADTSLQLLKQAKHISSKHILVFEDLTSIHYPQSWLNRNHSHQPGGMFRSDNEWRLIFELFGFMLHRSIRLKRKDDLDENTYRAFYHLLVE